MSDMLKGNVSDLASHDDDDPYMEAVTSAETRYVHVIADRRVANKSLPLVGLLRTVLFDEQPEIEFKVDLTEALATVKAAGLSFAGFELEHGTEVVKMPGPFIVKAARIQEIDPLTQTCVLALHLTRSLNK